MSTLILSAGPDVIQLLKFAGLLLILLLVVGVFYIIINHPKLPIPETLRSILNLLLVIGVVVGIIVYILLPLVQ